MEFPVLYLFQTERPVSTPHFGLMPLDGLYSALALDRFPEDMHGRPLMCNGFFESVESLYDGSRFIEWSRAHVVPVKNNRLLLRRQSI